MLELGGWKKEGGSPQVEEAVTVAPEVSLSVIRGGDNSLERQGVVRQDRKRSNKTNLSLSIILNIEYNQSETGISI